MNIPSIGHKFTLTKNWTARIHREARNNKFIFTVAPSSPQAVVTVEFPAGTVFRVERIYIRKGKSEYDSVTLYVGGEQKGRFWVKLNNFNEIQAVDGIVEPEKPYFVESRLQDSGWEDTDNGQFDKLELALVDACRKSRHSIVYGMVRVNMRTQDGWQVIITIPAGGFPCERSS